MTLKEMRELTTIAWLTIAQDGQRRAKCHDRLTHWIHFWISAGVLAVKQVLCGPAHSPRPGVSALLSGADPEEAARVGSSDPGAGGPHHRDATAECLHGFYLHIPSREMGWGGG